MSTHGTQPDQSHSDPNSAVPLTEKQKMLRGELYHSFSSELLEARARAQRLCQQYNQLLVVEERRKVLKELLGGADNEQPPWIEPPFRCDYGSNIYLGADVYMNFGTVILDCAKVTIGSRVLFAPNVQVYAATHPLDPLLRNGTKGPELAKEVTIGNDVWIGGNAIILPGVTIGDGAVVGAGSVVTRDVPPLTVVAGNPARVLRKIKPGEGHPQ